MSKELSTQPDYKALWQQMCERCDELDKKLAQRTWVGLTDEEQRDIAYSDINCWDWGELMDAVESKLKDKNAGR